MKGFFLFLVLLLLIGGGMKMAGAQIPILDYPLGGPMAQPHIEVVQPDLHLPQRGDLADILTRAPDDRAIQAVHRRTQTAREMPKSMPRWMRLARIVAMAVIIGIGLFNLYQAVANWTLSDASAYWNAALRIREGEALYPLVTNVEASEVYRYAPWFAWVTVPITWLPQQVAAVLWSVALLAASAVALWPLARAREWLLVALFGPILVGISATGNVHPLLVAALMLSVERRSGPVWIGVVASLKIFPILFVAVYVGRREWFRAALAVAVAALLWAPVLLYDLRGYVTDAGQAVSLVALPALWVLVIGAGVVLTLRLANTRFAWLTAATTVVLSLPRLFVYDDTYLMVGAVRRPPRSAIE